MSLYYVLKPRKKRTLYLGQVGWMDLLSSSKSCVPSGIRDAYLFAGLYCPEKTNDSNWSVKNKELLLFAFMLGVVSKFKCWYHPCVIRSSEHSIYFL